MAELYPGYDVLKKRDTPSWNEQTRRVIDARLALDPARHVFFSKDEWDTLRAVCDRIIPQPLDRPRKAPLAAMLDAKLQANEGDGYRDARLPKMREAWRRGLTAIAAESKLLHGRGFHEIGAALQDAMLTAVQAGEARAPEWGDMPPALFFAKRLLHDVVSAYYAWPDAWSDIGFGGPAGPRGYVRMSFDRRDPWEASEARPGRERIARRENARIR